MNFNDWLRSEVEDAIAEDNPERLRMIDCQSKGFELRETDPDGAFARFTEGRQIAQRLEEPWWALYYQKYRIDALIHFKRDYRQAVDMGVECVLELNKPGNSAFPGRVGVWDSLIAAYLGVDAEGYAEPIQQAIDTLDAEVPNGPSSDRYLLLARKQNFALETGRFQNAYKHCMESLRFASSDANQSRGAHFATFVFCELCEIGASVDDWEQVERWAKAGQELAEVVGHQCERSEAIAWQAVATLFSGNLSEAERLLDFATTNAKSLGMPPNRGFFVAVFRYNLGRKNLEGALAAREDELRTVENRGRLLTECRLHIDRCRMLGWLGRLTANDIEAARTAANKLRQPQQYLDQIAQLGVK